MQAEELKELVADIQKLKTEKQTIELKLANHGCPTKLFDTLSSFANQDDGGIIIFGVDENDDYKAKGVYDPQDLQKKSYRTMQANGTVDTCTVYCRRRRREGCCVSGNSRERCGRSPCIL